MSTQEVTVDDTRTTAEILRAARARISDQRNFVMGTLAWNAKGREVDPLASDARRWNARGAIWAESGVRPTPWKDSGTSKGHPLYTLLDQAARAIVEEIGRRDLLSQDAADNIVHVLTLRALDDAARLAEVGESGGDG